MIRRCRLVRPVTIQPSPDHAADVLPADMDAPPRYPWVLVAVDRGEAVLEGQSHTLIRVPESAVQLEPVEGSRG